VDAVNAGLRRLPGDESAASAAALYLDLVGRAKDAALRRLRGSSWDEAAREAGLVRAEEPETVPFVHEAGPIAEEEEGMETIAPAAAKKPATEFVRGLGSLARGVAPERTNPIAEALLQRVGGDFGKLDGEAKEFVLLTAMRSAGAKLPRGVSQEDVLARLDTLTKRYERDRDVQAAAKGLAPGNLPEFAKVRKAFEREIPPKLAAYIREQLYRRRRLEILRRRTTAVPTEEQRAKATLSLSRNVSSILSRIATTYTKAENDRLRAALEGAANGLNDVARTSEDLYKKLTRLPKDSPQRAEILQKLGELRAWTFDVLLGLRGVGVTFGGKIDRALTVLESAQKALTQVTGKTADRSAVAQAAATAPGGEILDAFVSMAAKELGRPETEVRAELLKHLEGMDVEEEELDALDSLGDPEADAALDAEIEKGGVKAILTFEVPTERK
jgi:hypothetical protein